MKEIPLLTANDIEVKVKQVFEKGAVLLLYKNARTDMNILDKVFGPENWTDEYKSIDGVLYCGIGGREAQDQPFVWKWSNGIESRKDDEGNEKKGEASDAFKRAGVMWGIGRELYSSPFIFAKVATIPDGKKYKLQDKFQTFEVSDIKYNSDRTIKSVTIVDNKGTVVFGLKNGNNKKVEDKDYELPAEPPRKQEPQNTIDEDVINDIWFYAQEAGLKDVDVIKWISKVFNKKEVETLDLAEANKLLARMHEIIKGGK